MIELKEFTKKFGDVTAVDAVSFHGAGIFGWTGNGSFCDRTYDHTGDRGLLK